MVQIIEENRKPSFAQKLSGGLGRGLESGNQLYQQYQKMGQENIKKQKMNEFGSTIGVENLGDYDPEIQKVLVTEGLKGKRQKELASSYDSYFQEEEKNNPLQEFSTSKPQPKGILKPEFENKELPKKIEKKSTLSKKLIPEKKIIEAAINKPAIADKLQKHNDNILAQIKHEENLEFQKEKEDTKGKRYKEDIARKDVEQLRQETLPVRKEIADRANAARQSIRQKESLIDIIKRGDINDPTYAIFAEALPFNIGKRMLSNDTVEYKSGLVDEFKDLSSIFKGATRVKEVELYENKLADIYLTDEQKLAILKSRINASKADIIKAEAATELEKEGKFYGALQFEEEVNKRAQPEMDALFNRILDEHAAVFKDAENRKAIALDPKDPEDKKIMDQIFKEAKGDKKEALKLGHKKGYKFK